MAKRDVRGNQRGGWRGHQRHISQERPSFAYPICDGPNCNPSNWGKGTPRPHWGQDTYRRRFFALSDKSGDCHTARLAVPERQTQCRKCGTHGKNALTVSRQAVTSTAVRPVNARPAGLTTEVGKSTIGRGIRGATRSAHRRLTGLNHRCRTQGVWNEPATFDGRGLRYLGYGGWVGLLPETVTQAVRVAQTATSVLSVAIRGACCCPRSVQPMFRGDAEPTHVCKRIPSTSPPRKSTPTG
jgi:hypothetical protein